MKSYLIIDFSIISTGMNQDHRQDRQEQLAYYMLQGLPNLRNTCYIISIIQVLFASKKFVREIEETKSKGTISSGIKDIFSLIMLNGSISAKKYALSNLIQVMKTCNKEIEFRSQQDQFHILLFIIDELSKQNPFFNYLFKIQGIFMCNCRNFAAESYFLANRQTCAQCKQPININLISQTELILIKFDEAQRQKVSIFKQFVSQQANLIYKCIGKVFYQGNSFSGHYTASRVCINDNQFIQFSDINVYEERGSNPRFVLYEKWTKDKEHPTQNHQNKPQSRTRRQTKVWRHDDQTEEIILQIQSLKNQQESIQFKPYKQQKSFQ